MSRNLKINFAVALLIIIGMFFLGAINRWRELHRPPLVSIEADDTRREMRAK